VAQEVRQPCRGSLDPAEEPPYDVKSLRQVHQSEDYDDDKRQRYPARKPARRCTRSWATLGDPPPYQDEEQDRQDCCCCHGLIGLDEEPDHDDQHGNPPTPSSLLIMINSIRDYLGVLDGPSGNGA
jgi:hypothetical protein